jgi:hypothetical protein
MRHHSAPRSLPTKPTVGRCLSTAGLSVGEVVEPRGACLAISAGADEPRCLDRRQSLDRGEVTVRNLGLLAPPGGVCLRGVGCVIAEHSVAEVRALLSLPGGKTLVCLPGVVCALARLGHARVSIGLLLRD